MPPVILRAGIGLDRDTGTMAENPESNTDLRNLFFLEQCVRLRGGVGASVQNLAGEDMVCYIGKYLAGGNVVYITYAQTSGDVNVYLADLQGQSPVLLGLWGTLASGAGVPPQFTTAESFDVLVLAHDEADVTQRLDTFRYDPASVGTEWQAISADLDGVGSVPVKFRGVYEWLGYVFGWGYGSASDPDRPEVVRSSSPDDPTVYEANHYARIGQRSVPVIGLCAVRESLGIWKAGQWWRVDGDQPANWQYTLIDPAVGATSARAIVNVNGRVHWWSFQGPRFTDGDRTLDAGLMLDLTGNPPPDLPASGPAEFCFALYYPDQRHLVYHHPGIDGATTLAHCASLRAPDRFDWAYWVLAPLVRHAALVNADEVSFIEPGYASNLVFTGSVGSGAASITGTWDHNAVVGDETIELWYETPGGVWSKLKEFSYASVAGATGATSFSGGALVSGTGQVALRYRRAGRFATGYESTDPDLWPIGAKTSVTIVVVATPIAVSFAYSIINGNIDIVWTPGDVTQDIDVRVVYTPDGYPTVLGPTVPLAAGTTTHTFVGPGFQDNARELAANVSAQVRHRIGAAAGSWVTIGSQILRWENLTGIDGFALAIASYRASVSLGTDVTLDVTRPSDQAGNLTITIGLGATTFGASPQNGGCPGSTGSGSGTSWPLQNQESLGSVVIPNTDPAVTPRTFTARPCSTCQLVGQLISMGYAGTGATGSSGSVAALWAKTGTLEFYTIFAFALPGRTGGPLITCGP